ncbi:unnamed protein product [Urochloa humidicola]
MVVGENGLAVTNGLSKYEAQASPLPASRRGQGSFSYWRYGGFWYPEHLMVPSLAMRDMFAARSTDVILATMPKSGTTWLKALVYAVVHRARRPPAAGDDHAFQPLTLISKYKFQPLTLMSKYKFFPQIVQVARIRQTPPEVLIVQ